MLVLQAYHTHTHNELALQAPANIFCCAHGGNGTNGKDVQLPQAQMWKHLVAVHMVALHTVQVSFPRPCSFHDRGIQHEEVDVFVHCLCIKAHWSATGSAVNQALLALSMACARCVVMH